MAYYFFISVLFALTSFCLLFIAYLAWKKREQPLAVSLCFSMLAGAFYSFGYAFEMLSLTMEQISFWLKVEYIGISLGPFMWFVMILYFVRGPKAVSKKVLLLAAVPVLTLITHYTNSLHFQFYTNVAIKEVEGFRYAVLTPGPFYKLHVLYSYCLFAAGMALLLNAYRKAANANRKKHIVLMAVGSCGPYIGAAIYLADVLALPIDYSPFGLLFSGVLYIWAIYRFNLLQLSPSVLDKVFESTSEAVIVFDRENTVSSFNSAARELFHQLNAPDGAGMPASRLLADYPDVLAGIQRGKTKEIKIAIAAEEASAYYTARLSPIYDRRRKLNGKLLMLSDSTEAVLLETALRAQAKQLEELNEFKDKMFTVVAHDIHSPLAVLSNLMELMQEDQKETPASRQEVISEMEQQIQSTLALAESLLSWFRSQRHGMAFDPVSLSLAAAADPVIQLLEVQSKQKKIRIQSCIPQHVRVYADPEMLALILRNLLSNAVKFTANHGFIQLNAEELDGMIVVSVQDTGKGLTEEQAVRLFTERKGALREGTHNEKGYGLGLILCREFIRVSGGDIWFDSEAGQGSVFFFSLPAERRAQEESG